MPAPSAEEVNPVPRTYVRGFGALPFGEVQNIHPRTHVRGVLWYGVNNEKPGNHQQVTYRRQSDVFDYCLETLTEGRYEVSLLSPLILRAQGLEMLSME